VRNKDVPLAPTRRAPGHTSTLQDAHPQPRTRQKIGARRADNPRAHYNHVGIHCHVPPPSRIHTTYHKSCPPSTCPPIVLFRIRRARSCRGKAMPCPYTANLNISSKERTFVPSAGY